jgi:hypothetical protein
MESFVDPNLIRCPLGDGVVWIVLSAIVVLLADGLCMSPSACLSPLNESQSFPWAVFGQSLTAFLATPIEM